MPAHEGFAAFLAYTAHNPSIEITLGSERSFYREFLLLDVISPPPDGLGQFISYFLTLCVQHLVRGTPC